MKKKWQVGPSPYKIYYTIKYTIWSGQAWTFLYLKQANDSLYIKIKIK